MLQRLGFRFTVTARNNRRLPGKPDLILPRHRVIVFVHGCFWHQHPGCPAARIPKTRSDWWSEKFRRNVARDTANRKRLEAGGWRVLTIWECELKRANLPALTLRLDSQLRGRSRYDSPDDPAVLRIAEGAARYK